MQSKRKSKPNKGRNYELDRVDYKILQLVLGFPGIKLNDIASHCKLTRQAVASRMQKPAYRSAFEKHQYSILEQISDTQLEATRQLRHILKTSTSERSKLDAIKLILYSDAKIITKPTESNPGGGMPAVVIDLGAGVELPVQSGDGDVQS